MMNVFHAGDGNLHPLLVFDAREPGSGSGVHAAGEEIVAGVVDAGGVLSASTGSASRSATSCRCCSRPTTSTPRPGCGGVRPDGVANPDKVLPGGQSVRRPPAGARGAWV